MRRTLRTRGSLLNSRQQARLEAVFDDEARLVVLVTWNIYQQIIAAYADPNRRHGKQAMTTIIDSIRRGVPAGLDEIAQLGRTLWRRRGDVLAYFDHHTSNGPTEGVNGRLEALRRNALGFRNLTQPLCRERAQNAVLSGVNAYICAPSRQGARHIRPGCLVSGV